jgi:hypothetical protein
VIINHVGGASFSLYTNYFGENNHRIFLGLAITILDRSKQSQKIQQGGACWLAYHNSEGVINIATKLIILGLMSLSEGTPRLILKAV